MLHKVTILLKMPKIYEMNVNGKKLYTQQELANETGRTQNAVKQFIYRNSIEPICSLNLYDESVLNAIKSSPGSGRPRKAPAPEPDAPTSKSKKAKP